MSASNQSDNAKRIYYFSPTLTEGGKSLRDILGSKGANLAEMTSIGLPVPPGFIITTQCCAEYQSNGGKLPTGLMDEVRGYLQRLESETGKTFGTGTNTLLVSVRSGAAISMPGMMDTVLNLGLTETSVAGLARATRNQRFARDALRRLIHMFGAVVMNVPHGEFESALTVIKKKFNVVHDTELGVAGLTELIDAYRRVYRKHTRQPFPDDPLQQLEQAIEAVFRSWSTPRAVAYRRIQNIRGLLGTAVNVQTMVFGNMGNDSGTGVAFTRDPTSGANEFYGEFLINAQGEDVVAGIRTPQPVADMSRWKPDIYKGLI
ncbi:MAG: PEP/pyruvate-binding domain-containing protein, partial [Lysobacterales bacterium]